jgi:hypothetical protein
MPNKDKIRKLEIKRNELVRNIHTCGYHKKKITNLVSELKSSHERDVISYNEHNKRLNSALDNKSPEHWIKYYDERINYFDRELSRTNEEIIKEEKKINIAPIILTLTILIILGAGLLLLRPTITGLIIGENITIEENISLIENITLPENITITENITIEEEPILIEENITVTEEGVAKSEEIIQGYAEINKPVKWIKKIKLDETVNNLTIELPKYISDIKISKVEDEIKEEISENKIKVIENGEIKPIEETNLITGGDILNLRNIGEWFSGITGFAILEDSRNITLKIEDEIKEVEIEYYTEAPKVIEKKISEFKKEVTVYSDVHYENILAYTTIKESPQNAIKLYRTTSGARESTQITNYTDRNNNGLIDEVSWIVPSLSNETYEVEINILNVQSYPTVGGNWEVRFTTVGKADLIVTAVDGTTWSNENNNNYLRFNKIGCGNNSLDYEWINNSVILRDYECNDVGYETSRVLTPGIHNLEFRFGDDVESAHNQASFQQNNYTIVYNVSSNTPWTVFNKSNIQLTPVTRPNQHLAKDGTNWSGAGANSLNGCPTVNLSKDDSIFCTLVVQATALNTDDWIRINFTINEAINNQFSNITSVTLTMSGDSGSTDVVNYLHLNSTGRTPGTLGENWTIFGATSAAEVTRTVTYSTLFDIQRAISNVTNQTVLLLSGTNHDAGETIMLDFVQVVVNITNYTLIPNNNPNNVSNLKINSTSILHLNLTTEDLQIRFNVSDPDVSDTLTYNITWFTNNMTNFTLKNIAIDNPGTGVENLTHQNTTKWDNWSAQIVVCDDSNACSAYVNTSALYIRNSNASITTPAFNQTTYNNVQIINVSVVFSDDDEDANSITFEWFKNNALIRRTTNTNLANGTNTTDVLTPASFTINDKIIVQAFAFDGERNSTLKNSTELTITSSNSAPNNPTPLINSTFATNLSAQDLNVYFTPTDPDAGETLRYAVWVFENNSILFNLSGISTTQDQLEVFEILPENTTKGMNYTAQVILCDDSDACSDYVNTSQLIILNTGPQITNVSINPTWSITVNGNTSAFFSFSVRDDDNYTDMNDTFANFSRGGETTRYNNTDLDGGCRRSGNFGKYIANYSCTINIVFYDGAGSWNVSLMLNDKSFNYTMNKTVTFNLGETTSFSLSDSSFTFPGATPDVYNITASDAIYMNNTGNDDINASGINITAVTIHGDTLGTTFIPARNFTVGNGSVGTNTNACDISRPGVFRLVNKSVDLTTGFNSTILIGTAMPAAVKPNNEQTLFLCLRHIPADLTGQVYSTDIEEAWSIIVN